MKQLIYLACCILMLATSPCSKKDEPKRPLQLDTALFNESVWSGIAHHKDKPKVNVREVTLSFRADSIVDVRLNELDGGLYYAKKICRVTPRTFTLVDLDGKSGEETWYLISLEGNKLVLEKDIDDPIYWQVLTLERKI